MCLESFVLNIKKIVCVINIHVIIEAVAKQSQPSPDSLSLVASQRDPHHSCLCHWDALHQRDYHHFDQVAGTISTKGGMLSLDEKYKTIML